MNRLAGIIAAAVLLASGGQATVWAQGGKVPKLAAVPLSVVIEDSVPPTTANPLGEASITGDDSPYEDGEAHPLRANIDEYGNLIIACGRLVHFQYGDPLTGTRSSVVTDHRAGVRWPHHQSQREHRGRVHSTDSEGQMGIQGLR